MNKYVKWIVCVCVREVFFVLLFYLLAITHKLDTVFMSCLFELIWFLYLFILTTVFLMCVWLKSHRQQHRHQQQKQQQQQDIQQ